jgi:hypothetical protein
VLKLGLIDEVVVNLVPEVPGSGRPFFATGALAEPQLPTDPVRWGRQRCRVSTLGEQDRRTLLSV